MWARRRGFENGAQVANIIARRGGGAAALHAQSNAGKLGSDPRLTQVLSDEIHAAMGG